MQDALGDDYNFVDLTGSCDTSGIEAEFARLGAPLQVLHIDDPHVRDIYDCSLLLLRPDLHVYWRGDALPRTTTELAEAATGHQGSWRPELAVSAHPAQSARRI
jgi:hypothetical protein